MGIQSITTQFKKEQPGEDRCNRKSSALINLYKI